VGRGKKEGGEEDRVAGKRTKERERPLDLTEYFILIWQLIYTISFFPAMHCTYQAASWSSHTFMVDLFPINFLPHADKDTYQVSD
jgi:hypothetical protein